MSQIVRICPRLSEFVQVRPSFLSLSEFVRVCPSLSELSEHTFTYADRGFSQNSPEDLKSGDVTGGGGRMSGDV